MSCTSDIHQALADKDLLPSLHLVDAGYIDAQLLVQSQQEHRIDLFGPTRINPSWQAREGGFDTTLFVIDWDNQRVTCPQGKVSRWWNISAPQSGPHGDQPGRVKASFSRQDCGPCAKRAKCVRSNAGRARGVMLPLREHYEALLQVRTAIATPEGQREYQPRAGVEGTLSQGIRRCGLRHTRYRGLAKTHLQHVATAVPLNVMRTVNHLQEKPLAKTRQSRFARLTA